jgi:hypothetical protein
MDVQILGHGDEGVAKVATYVAKYATKSSSEDPRLDGRIASLRDLEARALPAHLHQMAATALELDAEPALRHLHLARHAHRLGFGGHFLTKSRGYSTTFAALREARTQWNEARRATAVRYPKTGLPRATGGRSAPAGPNQGESLFASHQQRQRAEDRREVLSDWYTRSE